MTPCAVVIPPPLSRPTGTLPPPAPKPRRYGDAQKIWETMSMPADFCRLEFCDETYVFTGTECPVITIPGSKCTSLRATWKWGEVLEVIMQTDDTCPPAFAPDGRTVQLTIPRGNIEYHLRSRLHVRKGEIAKPDDASAVTVIRLDKAILPETLTIARAIID